MAERARSRRSCSGRSRSFSRWRSRRTRATRPARRARRRARGPTGWGPSERSCARALVSLVGLVAWALPLELMLLGIPLVRGKESPATAGPHRRRPAAGGRHRRARAGRQSRSNRLRDAPGGRASSASSSGSSRARSSRPPVRFSSASRAWGSSSSDARRSRSSRSRGSSPASPPAWPRGRPAPRGPCAERGSPARALERERTAIARIASEPNIDTSPRDEAIVAALPFDLEDGVVDALVSPDFDGPPAATAEGSSGSPLPGAPAKRRSRKPAAQVASREAAAALSPVATTSVALAPVLERVLDSERDVPLPAAATLGPAAIGTPAATEEVSSSTALEKVAASTPDAAAPVAPLVEASDEAAARARRARKAPDHRRHVGGAREGEGGHAGSSPQARLDVPPAGRSTCSSPRRSTRRLSIDREKLLANAQTLIETLAHYGVQGKVEDILPGPTVTTYEVSPAAGTKVSKVAGLADDLALALARKVRIVAPIPGKNRIGFELPNDAGCRSSCATSSRTGASRRSTCRCPSSSVATSWATRSTPTWRACRTSSSPARRAPARASGST